MKLYLPRAAAPDADETEVRKVQPHPAQSRSGTILVVEDNDLLAASVASMLRDQG